MKILVTGGAGFIGSHVADRYRALGHEVIVVDDLSTGRTENVAKGVRFYEADIGSPALAEIFEKEKPDAVNHLAAQISVRHSVEDPAADARVNILGSLNLLNLCRLHKVRKIVFSSTGGTIYGEQKTYPADETHPTDPRAPYGIAKLAVEKYLQFYYWTHKIPFTVLRYANVYGPRQNGQGEAGVIAIFMEKLLKSEAPVIYGTGKQTRDYVYVDDVVACNVEALNPDVVGVHNVATGVETDVATIAAELIALTGSKAAPLFAPAKAGEQMRSCLKPGALQKAPITPFKEGLEKTVKWFVERKRPSL